MPIYIWRFSEGCIRTTMLPSRDSYLHVLVHVAAFRTNIYLILITKNGSQIYVTKKRLCVSWHRYPFQGLLSWSIVSTRVEWRDVEVLRDERSIKSMTLCLAFKVQWMTGWRHRCSLLMINWHHFIHLCVSVTFSTKNHLQPSETRPLPPNTTLKSLVSSSACTISTCVCGCSESIAVVLTKTLNRTSSACQLQTLHLHLIPSQRLQPALSFALPGVLLLRWVSMWRS